MPLSRIVTLSLGLALTFPALAEAPAAGAPQQEGTAPAVPTDTKVVQRSIAACGSTGTRIRGRSNDMQPMRCYGKDDIDRTGQTDVASALRHLDPSIR